MAGLIGPNVMAIVLETVRPLYLGRAVLSAAFKAASVLLFTVDYLLRFWSCTARPALAAAAIGA